jgi:hypothetical protein
VPPEARKKPQGLIPGFTIWKEPIVMTVKAVEKDRLYLLSHLNKTITFFLARIGIA